MIRIAIDGNEANVAQRVGSNAYAFELISALEKILRDRSDVTVEVLLARSPAADFPKSRAGWTYQFFGPTAFWTQWALPWYLFFQHSKYQVFFTPGHYAPRISSVPYVSSVMDLAFLHFPNQFRKKDRLQLTEWTRYSVKNAQRIIAISEFTKQDLVQQYHLPTSKIVVAYPGFSVIEKANIKEKERIATLRKFKISRPYLLYVGTLQPRKNLLELISAFETLINQSKIESKKNRTKSSYILIDSGKLETLQLVIAGKVGWLAEPILERAKNSPLSSRIILTNYVTENEKQILYQESLGSILIGLYEGFGMPPLEAMAAGTIPIVSNTTSLPEVVGEAGIQVDPTQVSSITSGFKKLLVLPAKERATLLKKGRQQLKKFSWTTSAQVVLNTLMEVVAEHSISKSPSSTETENHSTT